MSECQSAGTDRVKMGQHDKLGVTLMPLMARLKQGDESALGEVVRHSHSLVTGLVRRQLSVARFSLFGEDVVQKIV